MVSVIIPALNEESTVAHVIALVKASPLVAEVIVVDDRSIDRTVEISQKAGARIVTSTKLGKGASMRDGLMVAKEEVVLFVDADIITYPTDLVERMCLPILKGETDFVKSYFSRQAGRVTELVAKPLLSIMYPDFPTFQQPLSGMVAGRREYLSAVVLEDGYGVDIALLIDMYKLGIRISEVDIGHIENKMQTLEQLGRMSREVASVILERSNNPQNRNLEVFEGIHVIREQMEFALSERTRNLSKLAIIDMDRTLLRGSFIQTCAERFDFKRELIDIVTAQPNAFIRTKQIARLLKGRGVNELIQVAESIPVSANAEMLIYELRSKGYHIGIISDSYDYITNYFVNKLRLDFSLSNELEFSKSVVTGEVKIPSFFLPHPLSVCTHEICKTHAITHLCQQRNIELSNTLTIGDGENDICMTKNSGIGVAYCATHPNLNLVADFIVSEPDLGKVVDLI